MDDVTGIGDEKVLRQYNQWREVCRWDVEGDGPIEDEDDGLSKADWRGIAFEHEHLIDGLRALADSLIACYEELAGEHRELVNALQSPSGVVCSMPLAADGEVAVRPYKRSKPRRSKLVETEPDHPTVQADPAAGDLGASSDEPEALPEESMSLICQGLADCAEGRVSKVELSPDSDKCVQIHTERSE